MRRNFNPWVAFAGGLGLFAAVGFAARALEANLGLGLGAYQVVLKGLLLAVSLLFMALDGRSWGEFGFRRPSTVRWGRVIGSGALLGALATGLILATPAEGLGLIKQMSLVQIVLGVWLGSSLAEEVFTRGLIQSVVNAESAAGLLIRGVRFSAPVLVGGLLFGSLHLGLIFRDTDPWTVGIVLVFATLLGLVAGRFREASGSLWPAFVAHVAFNLGGIPIGIAAAIAKKLSS